jgi:peptidoglycan/LPS O-acetylase OafA/YrhL
MKLTADVQGLETPVLPAHHLPAAARQRQANLFDLLRVIAATMVLWGHAFSLTGGQPPGWFGNAIGTIGVKIFFVISGLLITRSWLADPRPWAYAMRRVLRIMPALILVVLITVGVMGPLVTMLPLRDYMLSGGTRLYLWNILLYPVYSLPGVFANNPYPFAVNGSLWSLPAEVLMYIMMPFIIGRSAGGGRLGIVICVAISAVVGIYFVRIAAIAPVPVVYGTSILSVLDVATYFQVGSLFAVFALERFARPVFSILLLLASAMAIQVVSKTTDAYVVAEMLLMLTLPFAVVSVGSVTVGGQLGRMLSLADVSYGLYLYGFPIQQLISATSGGRIGPVANFALALPLTFVGALLSWKTVEHAALRLKPRRPSSKRATSLQ